MSDQETRLKATSVHPVSNMGDATTPEIAAVLSTITKYLSSLQEALTDGRQRRDILVLELINRGLSEREVASVAGISGVMVHKIKEAARG